MGGLRVDLRAGWQTGGDSGQPAIIPDKPDEGPLSFAVPHDVGTEAMPPNQPRLSDPVIADFEAWVKMGAPDPREGDLGPQTIKRDRRDGHERG